jgi:hypothetical protein
MRGDPQITEVYRNLMLIVEKASGHIRMDQLHRQIIEAPILQ